MLWVIRYVTDKYVNIIDDKIYTYMRIIFTIKLLMVLMFSYVLKRHS